MNFRIRNQVLANKLTRTSSKIIKFSSWEMLVNYQWIWWRLSWQVSCLMLICKRVQFEWVHLLHPKNEAEIPNKFSSINYISDQHWWANTTIRDICFHLQLILKQITLPYIYIYNCSGSGYLVCQPNSVVFSQWDLANRKSPVRPASAVPPSLWIIPHLPVSSRI